jgi:DNA-binding NarL/FixJ family response regulator
LDRHIGKTSGGVAIVADNDALVRSGLSGVLQRKFLFARVIEASSLGEVLEIAEAVPQVQLASIELGLPGMLGVASLVAIRTAVPMVRLAVFSTSERRNDILAALGAGVHGFIPKSFQLSQITNALRTVIEGNVFVPSVLADRSAETERPPSGRETRALSPRQTEVLKILALGKTNREISEDLQLSEATVKIHVQAILRGLGVRNRAEAIVEFARLQKAGNAL